MKFLRRAVALAVLLYLSCLLVVAGCQRRMIYKAEVATAEAMLTRANANGLQPWKDERGEIVAWHRPNPSAARRLVVIHGGEGFALHRTFYAEGFHQQNWDVWLFEYPGYGGRPGTAGKDAFVAAARTFIEALSTADPRPLYVFGESLGSGTACAVAGSLPDRVAGVALMVPFAQLMEVAQWHFPFLPIPYILRDDFDNIASLRTYQGPVVIVVADHDEIVSPDQGRKLFAAYTGPKHLITLPSKHADFPTVPSAKWWQEVTAFLDRKH